MKPIQLHIRRKTKVPTNKQIVHRYRSDWKTVGRIAYIESEILFKTIGDGKIETDADFAKFIRDNYGTGIYYAVCWMRGRRGFFCFIKIEIRDKTYLRLKKKKSQEQLENLRLKRKKEEISANITHVEGDDSEELISDLDEVMSDMKLNDEIIDEDSKNRYGPGGYLKTIRPIYQEHLYDESGSDEDEVVMEHDSLW